MTAEQIRKVTIGLAEEFQCAMLQEIAAQLAELNQTLRDVHPELTLPTECSNPNGCPTCFFTKSVSEPKHGYTENV